jgi:hypothetical protein
MDRREELVELLKKYVRPPLQDLDFANVKERGDIFERNHKKCEELATAILFWLDEHYTEKK